MIDYKKIPDWWAVCPHSNCPMAETCLRQQACRQMPQEVKFWTCVLTHAQKDGECPYYLKYEKVMMAQGLNSIYKDGERLINPKLQQEIINIVHRYAPGVEVTFDKSYADYDFTTNNLGL